MSSASSRNREIRLDGRSALRILDAAYRLDLDEDAWLDGLTDALAPTIDLGSGVHAFLFDVGGELSHPRLHGGDPEWASSWRTVWWETLMKPMDASTLSAIASSGPLAYTRDIFATTSSAVPTFEDLLDSVGASRVDEGLPQNVARYPDSLNFIAHDLSGRGVGFCANRARLSEGPPASASVEVAGLIAAHLAAAIRLRSRRDAERSAIHAADVVLSDRGEVLDVREGARLDAQLDALRDAARTVVYSKKRSAEDGDGRASLALWQVLFSKAFSVVDVYEQDGHRYLVAKRNRPELRGDVATSLTRREREVVGLLARGHSNKLIAYELALSASTVANHIASASRKLGVGSVRELILAAVSAPSAERRGERS